MKKTMKRVISLCLVVVMLTGVMCVSAFAATNTNVKKYNNYVVFGDSICTGFGLDMYGTSDTHAKEEDMVAMNAQASNGVFCPGSYPAIVANAVGATSVYDAGRPALRSVEVRRMLDSTYKGDQYTDYVVNAAYISDDDWAGLVNNTTSAVKTADLITINIGSDDVLLTGIIAVSVYLGTVQAVQKSSALHAQLVEAKAKMADFSTMGEALVKMLDIAEKVGSTSGALAALSSGAIQGTAQFKVNWNIIIKTIHKLNPTAKIVVVGMYNPFRDLKLTEKSAVSIGKLANQVVNMMNLYMSGSVYSKYYTFVSVLDTQIYPFDPIMVPDENSTNGTGYKSNFLGQILKNVHPTADGHVYMANQIINALPAADTSAASCSVVQYGQNMKTVFSSILGSFAG
jgi:lysophospholipase L1-like esterase